MSAVEEEHTGMVATCSAKECAYNENMNCSAPSISVSKHADHADCETFHPKG
ncbi:MAG TPA: DUF1540 domain-containing protein [Candidatus Subteraquimicrobiales bacterium]